MTIWRHFHPSYGLAVYDASQPSLAIMADPGSYPTAVKFHSNFRYPVTQTRLADATITLPAQTSTVAGVSKGTYDRSVYTIGAHGQSAATPPMIKGMLINYNGANVPLQGSFPVQRVSGAAQGQPSIVGNFCRIIDLAVDGANVVLVSRGFTQTAVSIGASAINMTYPAVTITVRVWVFSWVLDGSPDLYDASLPQLKLTSSKIQVGRGKFDTDRDYIRSATGAENTLLTRGETWQITGTNGLTTNPSFGWRYAVDSYSMEGQVGGSGTASFTRIQLP